MQSSLDFGGALISASYDGQKNFFWGGLLFPGGLYFVVYGKFLFNNKIDIK